MQCVRFSSWCGNQVYSYLHNAQLDLALSFLGLKDYHGGISLVQSYCKQHLQYCSFLPHDCDTHNYKSITLAVGIWSATTYSVFLPHPIYSLCDCISGTFGHPGYFLEYISSRSLNWEAAPSDLAATTCCHVIGCDMSNVGYKIIYLSRSLCWCNHLTMLT